jgi:hypothetical protein
MWRLSVFRRRAWPRPAWHIWFVRWKPWSASPPDRRSGRSLDAVRTGPEVQGTGRVQTTAKRPRAFVGRGSPLSLVAGGQLGRSPSAPVPVCVQRLTPPRPRGAHDLAVRARPGRKSGRCSVDLRRLTGSTWSAVVPARLLSPCEVDSVGRADTAIFRCPSGARPHRRHRHRRPRPARRRPAELRPGRVREGLTCPASSPDGLRGTRVVLEGQPRRRFWRAEPRSLSLIRNSAFEVHGTRGAATVVVLGLPPP